MARRRKLFIVAGLLAIAGVHRVVQRPLARALDLPVAPAGPEKDGALRLATWNLRNFPLDHDRERMAATLAQLAPDVIGLQEINDADAARALLPDHVVHVSRGGGRHGQLVGIAYDPRVVELVDGPREHAELTMDGRVRPAFAARLRHRSSGLRFEVIVVHLKATPEGLEVRQLQWDALADRVRAVEPDVGVVVLGDFNTTGPRSAGPAIELAAVDAALGRVGLQRLDVVGGCTAYWEGVRHDAYKEPSMLDLVWVRPQGPLHDTEAARPWGACARHACRPLRSTDAYPDPDLGRGSDHCPITVDIPVGRSSP
jgi:endonuclease/exonuclease/phosphatase family metal-dependent hydrolase